MDAQGKRGLKRSRDDYHHEHSSRDDGHAHRSRDNGRDSSDDRRHHGRDSSDDRRHHGRHSSHDRRHHGRHSRDRYSSSQGSDAEEQKMERHRSSYDRRHGLHTRYDHIRSSSQDSYEGERKKYHGGQKEERNTDGERGGDCKGHNKQELTSPSQPESSLLVATHSGDNTTQCLVLGNVFDAVRTASKDLVLSDFFGAPVSKRNPVDLWKIEDSVQMKCAEFGQIEHIHAHENGLVYLRFSTKRIAVKAQEKLDGSLFDGRRITATFMAKDLYTRMFPVRCRKW